MGDVDRYQDVIDSRDVIARIEELQEAKEAELEALDVATLEESVSELEELLQSGAATQGEVLYAKARLDEARAHRTEYEFEDEDELAALLKLQDECEGYSDWTHGETLIRDSYFRDYAMQLADDICAIPSDASWPLTCIDWDKAARELQYDYSQVSYGDVTYWIRG